MERQEGDTVSSKFVQSQFAWVHFKNSGQEWVLVFFVVVVLLQLNFHAKGNAII